MPNLLVLFSNNATSTLAAPVTSSATTAVLAPGTGELVPSPSDGQYFPLTFMDAATQTLREIVYVTGLSGDTITAMTRGQEGTTAQAYALGDYAQALITAGTLSAIVTYLNSASTAPTPASYVFSALPAASGLSVGAMAFCADGCNIGETSGNGTGTLVNVKSISDVNTWCAIWSGIAVTH